MQLAYAEAVVGEVTGEQHRDFDFVVDDGNVGRDSHPCMLADAIHAPTRPL
jgi:hypothetical protein